MPAYQPEAAWTIFTLAMFNSDIATGTASTAGSNEIVYCTSGKSSTWDVKNDPPPMPQPTCYVLQPETSRTDEQLHTVTRGSETVQNFIVMDNNTKGFFDGLGRSDPQTGQTANANGLYGQDVGNGSASGGANNSIAS